MITGKDIVIDPNPILRTKCDKVTFPISEELKETAKEMRQHIINSLDEELCEKYDLTPAVGLAAPQINLNAQLCCVYITGEDDEGNVETIDLTMLNPRIMAYSEEKVYLEQGEACLSIKEKHEGYVPRHAYIKVKYYDLDGQEHIHEAYDFEAIAIQHEIDHLNGILFYDHINKQNPFAKIPNSFGL